MAYKPLLGWTQVRNGDINSRTESSFWGDKLKVSINLELTWNVKKEKNHQLLFEAIFCFSYPGGEYLYCLTSNNVNYSYPNVIFLGGKQIYSLLQEHSS